MVTLDRLGPETLRDLAAVLAARAAALEAADPTRIAFRRLSAVAVEELADMLVEGRRPTIGAWRRWLR